MQTLRGFLKSQSDDPIKTISDPINIAVDPIKNVLADPINARLYQAIVKNNSLNYAEYGTLLDVSQATVKRRLKELKNAGLVVRVGSNKSGYWEICQTSLTNM